MRLPWTTLSVAAAACGCAFLQAAHAEGSPDDKQLTPLRPSADITKEIVEMKGKLPGSGALLIGDKGKIFSQDDYGAGRKRGAAMHTKSGESCPAFWAWPGVQRSLRTTGGAKHDLRIMPNDE